MLRYDGENGFVRSDGTLLTTGRRFPAVVVPEALFADLDAKSIDLAVADAVVAFSSESGPYPASAEEFRQWWPSDYESDHEEKYPFGLRDYHFRFVGDGTVELIVETGKDCYRDEPYDWICHLVTPLLRRYGAVWLGFDGPGEDPGSMTGSEVFVHARVSVESLDGASLVRIAEEIRRLIDAVDGGKLSLSTAADLVRTGHGRLLEGQPEGAWLDVKQQPYRLDGLPGKLELAKDVASFANAGGGLLLVGARADIDQNGERVTEFGTLPLGLVSVQQMRDVIADRVFPTILDLEVTAVSGEREERGVVMLHVPPQPESSKPFLVRGIESTTKLASVFVAIPTRQGEGTAWADVATLHALVSAGRLALKSLDSLDGDPA